MTTLRLLFLALTLCFADCVNAQNFNYSVKTKDSEKGYLGKIDNVKLFYEIWKEDGAAGTTYNSVILRTDTSDMSDTVDFSFVDNDNNYIADSITVTISRNDTSITRTTTNAKDIPTVFQILIPVEFGYQYFYDFNKPGSYQTFYSKGHKLYMSYLTRSRYETGTIVSKIYALTNGQFQLLKTDYKELKDTQDE